MKFSKNYFLISISILIAMLFISCQTQTDPVSVPLSGITPGGPSNCGDKGKDKDKDRCKHYHDKIVADVFVITLLNNAPMDNGDGTQTWIWSIENINAPNEEHHFDCDRELHEWGFTLDGSACQFTDIIKAGYSKDNVKYHYFKPEYEMEKDEYKCLPNTKIFEFEYGLNDSKITYYKIITSKIFQVGDMNGALKTEHNGCITVTFHGIGTLGGGNNGDGGLNG